MLSFTASRTPGPDFNGHPIHIHGYTPQVVTVQFPEYNLNNNTIRDYNSDIVCFSDLCHQGARWRNVSWAGGNHPDAIGPYAPRKDTVLVPVGGYIVLRFKADNPGK